MRLLVGADPVAVSRHQFAFLANQHQRRFEGCVVEITSTSKLWVIRIARTIQFGAEQIEVSIANRHGIHVQRLAEILLVLVAFPEDVGYLGYGVHLLGTFFVRAQFVQLFDGDFRVAMEYVQQIVVSEQGDCSARRLWA